MVFYSLKKGDFQFCGQCFGAWFISSIKLPLVFHKLLVKDIWFAVVLALAHLISMEVIWSRPFSPGLLTVWETTAHQFAKYE